MDWNSIYHSFIDEDSYHIGKVVCEACTGKIRLASRALIAQRRSLCNMCEFRNRLGLCTKCGCRTNWKTVFAKSRCPIKIW